MSNCIPLHPRIDEMTRFYNGQDKVCPFMSASVTRFVLVPETYNDNHIAPAMLDWAKSTTPLALTYIWEKDPHAERDATIGLFGNLLRVLVEDMTQEKVDAKGLEAELAIAFAPESDVHPMLGYEDKPFYAVAMGPKHTSRYAPCASMVITKMSDVAAVHKDIVATIRQRAFARYGAHYDATGVFLEPRP